MASFNTARAELADQVAEARILGPAWIVERATALEANGQELVNIVSRMNTKFMNADSEFVQQRVAEMAYAINELVDEAARKLN
jgi:hypothetical protein